MQHFFLNLFAFIAGGLFLVILDRIMQPVPVAAMPAFVLGAVAYFLSRPARVMQNVLAASFVGAIAGIFIHRQWHLAGKSPQPAEGMLNHLALEGLIGLVAALICLGLISLARKVLLR